MTERREQVAREAASILADVRAGTHFCDIREAALKLDGGWDQDFVTGLLEIAAADELSALTARAAEAIQSRDAALSMWRNEVDLRKAAQASLKVAREALEGLERAVTKSKEARASNNGSASAATDIADTRNALDNELVAARTALSAIGSADAGATEQDGGGGGMSRLTEEQLVELEARPAFSIEPEPDEIEDERLRVLLTISERDTLIAGYRVAQSAQAELELERARHAVTAEVVKSANRVVPEVIARAQSDEAALATAQETIRKLQAVRQDNPATLKAVQDQRNKAQAALADLKERAKVAGYKAWPYAQDIDEDPESIITELANERDEAVELLRPLSDLWSQVSEDDRVRRAWLVNIRVTSDVLRRARSFVEKHGGGE